MASRVDGGKHAVAANTFAPVIVAQDRSASCGSVSFIQLQASLHLFTYKIASSKRANVQNYKITGSGCHLLQSSMSAGEARADRVTRGRSAACADVEMLSG